MKRKSSVWRKAAVIAASLAVMASAALPASAAALSEDFESFGSTDDLSMNWFPYGDFLTDITLSKTGGVNNSQAMKFSLTFSDAMTDKWGTARGAYPDDMSSKTATGFRFWAKSDVEGLTLKVLMVYNNMSWKYASTVTLSKTGKYYEVPFSSMELDYGTVTVDNGTDPQYINEWQLEPQKGDLEITEATVTIDDISYIGDGPDVTPPSDDPTTEPPETSDTEPPVTSPSDEPDPEPSDEPTADEPEETDATDPSEETAEPEATTEPGTTNDTSGTTEPTEGALSDDVSNPPEGGLGTGAIVGIVIGVAVVLAGAGTALYYFVIRKKGNTPQDPPAES